ncbi:hypothetical protein EMIHUDRAFT_248266 [Emiliania huxleyi CCMP1516]|uniref:TLDc domain-containing protein n=2 Tax=Emiliania huxleyi TaxID=2903 RepID=A0A0D3IHL6_EMIH1|nr:hypothetical protein EMIHUDRAFT_248266 [Emiliania huxleyi CCMP1516]EOD10751.1 hypothetical protein EMIHUDRAFT_248266 [Emiliania huxleyi CCMP1516]|eukprot:XP_005763180.1 hypothetical protein EMIHUDRAFT_248266 [Emiliania huxleyi CCMP1516]
MIRVAPSAADGHRSARVAHQFFNCAQEMPEGEATFATLEALGRPTQDCWFHRIPQRDLDPAVAAGDTNISILAVVTGGACGESTALGFTAGPAVRDYFVQGKADTTADQWHLIHPYFQSQGTPIAAIAFHMGGAEHSDSGFIIAGPRHQSTPLAPPPSTAQRLESSVASDNQQTAARGRQQRGFNFCDGAPLTGGERLELCYFPAALGIRSFAGGDGETEPIDPCFEANFARDPHLSLPRGGRADFRGRDGQYYCFLSAPRLAINIKTEDATFRLHNLHDKGGTLVHFVARVGGRKNKLCLASFWASEFNEYNTGFNMINGSCGGGHFFLGTGNSKKCEEILIEVRFSSAEFTVGDWASVVRGNWAFASTEPRHGRVDEYPASGTFRTSAMAEGAAACAPHRTSARRSELRCRSTGAIEGEAAMYEVAAPHTTTFRFSRFEAAEATEGQPGLLAADAAAASSDGAIEASHLASRRRLSEYYQPLNPGCDGFDCYYVNCILSEQEQQANALSGASTHSPNLWVGQRKHDCAQHACGNTENSPTHDWHPDCTSPTRACGFYLGWGGIEYCSKFDKDHPCIFYAYGDWTGFYAAGGPDGQFTTQGWIHCSSRLAGLIIQLMPKDGNHYFASSELDGPLGGEYRIVGNWARGDCQSELAYCPDGSEVNSDGLLDEVTRPTDWPMCWKKCYNVGTGDPLQDPGLWHPGSDCDPICRWP